MPETVDSEETLAVSDIAIVSLFVADCSGIVLVNVSVKVPGIDIEPGTEIDGSGISDAVLEGLEAECEVVHPGSWPVGLSVPLPLTVGTGNGSEIVGSTESVPL